MKGIKVSRNSVVDRKDSRKESGLKRLLRLLSIRRSPQAEQSHSEEQPAVQDFHTLSTSPAPSINSEAPSTQQASDFALSRGDWFTEEAPEEESSASSSVDDSFASRKPKIVIDSQFSLPRVASFSSRSSASGDDSRKPEVAKTSRNLLRPKVVIDNKFDFLRRVADANEVQYTR